MTNEQLRALLNLWMISDPWPTSDPSDEPILSDWIDEECQRHGFADRIDAYHRL